jgi:hypothetical protein
MTDLLHPPTIEPRESWLNSRRAHLVAALEAYPPARRGLRSNWRLAAIAIGVLLFAGAAVAATGYTFFDWLRSDQPGAARFSIDPSRTVDWPAPAALVCPSPGEEFACAQGSSGGRVYEFLSRVESRGPRVTRTSILDAVEAGERAGRITPEIAARAREEIAAVGDEFFEKLNILLTFTSIASPHGSRPGYVRVPPAGVPQFAICEPDGDGFRCRSLAAAVDVPVGAPIYALRESADWVERPQPSGPGDAQVLFESVFGRPLTPAEERLLITLSTPAGSSGEGTSGATTSGG